MYLIELILNVVFAVGYSDRLLTSVWQMSIENGAVRGGANFCGLCSWLL